MGGSVWGARDWTTYAATSAVYAKSVNYTQVFKSRDLDPYLDPSKFLMRESRHSDANPKSTPIMVFLDTSASMGAIGKEIAQSGLGQLIRGIFDRKPVTDPHIAFGGIGDVVFDEAPLQVSQFEADIRIVEQLEKIYMESGGGANNYESYNLAWHFANFHTSADAFEKDGRKGFLFTIGDEMPPQHLTAEQLSRVYGRQETALSNGELLEQLGHNYHVFHLMIEEGNFMRGNEHAVRQAWSKVLGQNAVSVSDYRKLGKIMTTIMEVVSGKNKAEVLSEIETSDLPAVKHAIETLQPELW